MANSHNIERSLSTPISNPVYIWDEEVVSSCSQTPVKISGSSKSFKINFVILPVTYCGK